MKLLLLRQFCFISLFHCFNSLANKITSKFRSNSFSNVKMVTDNSYELGRLIWQYIPSISNFLFITLNVSIDDIIRSKTDKLWF